MKKKYYKVVTDKMESVCSLFGNIYGKNGLDPIIKEDLVVQYEIGTWATSHSVNPALFVFKHEVSALHFARLEAGFYNRVTSLNVYECEVKNIKRYMYLCDTHDMRDFFKILKTKLEQKKSVAEILQKFRKSTVPNATVAVGGVKLTKLVATYNP